SAAPAAAPPAGGGEQRVTAGQGRAGRAGQDPVRPGPSRSVPPSGRQHRPGAAPARSPRPPPWRSLPQASLLLLALPWQRRPEIRRGCFRAEAEEAARMLRALAGVGRGGEGAPGPAPGPGPGPGLGRGPEGARPVPAEPPSLSPGWAEVLAAAAGALQAGGLVAVPTDTVYGVACLAQDPRAVRSIYGLKGRNGRKPLAICLGDVEHIYRYCHVNVPDELLRDLLPGPVTLVLKRSEELNKDLNPFTSLVGVRIPNHPFIRELARACSGPLALTSANISSQASTLTVSEFQDLWPQLSLVIDGGPVGDVQSPECRLGSTVVDLSVSGKYTIIRPGCALQSTVEILRQKYGLVPESS
uniref:Threonylcarbamoyl-AMP synthase n=1 Tax=Anas zonorhyncha TaxID=75864 RepID=A0A8B9VLX8_9AVES